MSDSRTSFLTYYIQSLGERTREEKRGTKFGFYWDIYNLALAEDWIPHRLPFVRAGGSETSKTKTEPEFGVDLAFLSQDLKTLRIFVLKDEILKNSTWGTHSFDIDIRNHDASATGNANRQLRRSHRQFPGIALLELPRANVLSLRMLVSSFNNLSGGTTKCRCQSLQSRFGLIRLKLDNRYY